MNKVGILVYDGCMLASVASTADTLRVAEVLSNVRGGPVVTFDVVLVNARGQERVRTGSGITVAGLSSDEPPLDLLLVPGYAHSSVAELIDRLPHLAPELDYVRRVAMRGAIVAAACSGTFIAAEAGVLDGHRATTSWWLAAAFRRRYPKIRLEADALVVNDARVLTSGAATAVQQLVLKLVACTGGEALAQQTSRMLAIDPDRQSQAPYVSDALIERPRHSLSERAERFLQKSLHEELSVAALAAEVGTSERSLLRHFRAHYGKTPLAQIQHLRVERAKALLESTHLTFDEIVERCGYIDVSSFRKLFKRATALTPAAYRERFRLRAV